jgi:hypothetical protein
MLEIDPQALIDMLTTNADRLKGQINSVVDYHVGDLVDTITLTEMLTTIGQLIVDSSSESRPIEVTVRFK